MDPCACIQNSRKLIGIRLVSSANLGIQLGDERLELPLKFCECVRNFRCGNTKVTANLYLEIFEAWFAAKGPHIARVGDFQLPQ